MKRKNVSTGKLPTENETILRVVQIIVEKFGVDEIFLSYDTSFADDLNIDSLDIYELFMTIEKEFRITIPDEDAEKLLTVGMLIDYIDEKLPMSSSKEINLEETKPISREKINI